MSTQPNMITVFYAGQLYGEFPFQEYYDQPMPMPDGAYVLYPRGHWYIQIHGGLSPINLSDLPEEIKVYRLLGVIP